MCLSYQESQTHTHRPVGTYFSQLQALMLAGVLTQQLNDTLEARCVSHSVAHLIMLLGLRPF